ncbi:MAG: flagellar hook-basal body complex protein FliE [Opitutaceae bacterium]|nr:flagellar hook-basal body complex protein FliE [Opitutaceae bacterium]
MSLIGSISGVQHAVPQRLSGTGSVEGPFPALSPKGGGAIPLTDAQPASFSSIFETMVAAVDAKQSEAQALTRQVLLGQNDQLHSSVIAMQEAGVAFQLMVEVRNKLVDSYQELMRMPV